MKNKRLTPHIENLLDLWAIAIHARDNARKKAKKYEKQKNFLKSYEWHIIAGEFNYEEKQISQLIVKEQKKL